MNEKRYESKHNFVWKHIHISVEMGGIILQEDSLLN